MTCPVCGSVIFVSAAVPIEPGTVAVLFEHAHWLRPVCVRFFPQGEA